MSGMKQCPICDRQISADADQCVYCKTDGLRLVFLTKQAYEEWRQREREKYRKRKPADGVKISAGAAGTQSGRKNTGMAQTGNQAKNRTGVRTKTQTGSQTRNAGGAKKVSAGPARQAGKKTRADWENIFRQWDREYDEALASFDEATAYEYRDWYPSVNEPSSPAPSFTLYEHWIGEKIDQELEQAKKVDDCDSFCILSEKLADVLHKVHEDDHAYEVEHTAFLFQQAHICRKADIPLSCFGGKTPCLEYLKNALTSEADLALEKNEYAEYYLYKMLNARICRAQGQEDNAYMLEKSAYYYKRSFDRAVQKKWNSQRNFEKELLRHIVKKYGDSLYVKD